MTATTWDTALKSAAGMALSGGNLTATATAAASVGATRACSGKTYFQVTLGSAIATAQLVGLVAKGFVFGTTLLGAGSASASIGYKSSDGTVKINNATVATIQTSAANAVVDVAYDPIARLIWFRTNNGNWNNDPAANPATSAGGIDTSALVSPLYPAWGAAATGNNATAVFTSGFTNTPPTGFITVDTIQIGGINSVTRNGASFTTMLRALTRTPPASTRRAIITGSGLGGSGSGGGVTPAPSSYGFA